MTEDQEEPLAGWVLHATERSRSVERSRRRSAERAQQIVRAARLLVEERGAGFTTQDLVKAAGLAVQTLYKYFPSKDHILLAVLEDMNDAAVKHLEEEAARLDDPVDRLRLFVHGVIGRLDDDRTGAHFVIGEHWRLVREHPEDVRRVTRPVEQFIERQLRAAAATGSLRPNDAAADAWLATQLLLAVFHTLACDVEPDVAAAQASTWAFCFAAWGGVQPSVVHGQLA